MSVESLDVSHNPDKEKSPFSPSAPSTWLRLSDLPAKGVQDYSDNRLLLADSVEKVGLPKLPDH